MPHNDTTFGNTTWSILGAGVFGASQWLVLVLIAKELGVEQVGRFALGIAIASPVFTFLSFQLRTHYATARQHKWSFGDYLGLRILAGLVAVILTTMIAGFLDVDTETAIIIAAIAWMKFSDLIADIFYAPYQHRQCLRFTAISLSARAALGTIAFAVVVHFIGSCAIAIIVMALIWFGLVLAIDTTRIEELRINFRPNFTIALKTLLQATWSMGLAAMLSSVAINLPRYLIELEFTEYELGQFAAQAYVVTILGMISLAFGQAISAKLAGTAYTDRIAFAKCLAKPILVVAVLSLCTITAGIAWEEHILSTIYSRSFITEGKSFTLILIAAGIWSITNLIDYAIIALRSLWIRPIGYVSAIVLMMATWLASVDKNGVDAAAYALLVGAGTQFTILLSSLSHYFFVNNTANDK